MPTRYGTGNCSFEGCGRRVSRIGLCAGHYLQHRKGMPLRELKKFRPAGTPPVVKFTLAPCPRKDLPGPCHIFSGPKARGYGIVNLSRVTHGKKTNYPAHRYVWEQIHGPIPKGLMIDHQCMVKACCNPDHLRVVTPKVNSTENVVGANWQLQLARTHCPKGHEYTPENTYGRPSRKRERTCLECRRAYDRIRSKFPHRKNRNKKNSVAVV